MAVYIKAISGSDIVNGICTVSPRDTPVAGSVLQTYDGSGLRTQHLASGDSLAEWQRIDLAYLVGGGFSNWEH